MPKGRINTSKGIIMGEIFNNKKTREFWETLASDGLDNKVPEEQPDEDMYREMLKQPKYSNIRLGINKLTKSLSTLDRSWREKNRTYTLKELENLLQCYQEIEKMVSGVTEQPLREYLYDELNSISASRRSLYEDVRWDVEANAKAFGPPGTGPPVRESS